MFLIFNKEFRQFESIISELAKKAKKSSTVTRKGTSTSEIYYFDTLSIEFNVSDYILTVRDKADKEIVSIDCKFYNNDALQTAKFHQFSGLLEKVRKIYNKDVEKNKKFKEANEKLKKAQEAKRKQQLAEATKNQVLSDALNRLRGM